MKQVVYYTDERGRSPVAEYIKELPPAERDKCLEYLTYLERTGESLRRPIGDYLGGKLYELRPRQTRIIYFFMLKDYAVVVHAFRKKTNAIPEKEIKTAAGRMNEFLDRYTKRLIKL